MSGLVSGVRPGGTGSRRGTRAAVALILACLVSSCATHTAPHTAAPHTAAGNQLSTDLAALRGSNGLYTGDAEGADPGLDDSAFGLTTLAAAGDDVRRPDLDVSWLRWTTREQVADDPLYARLSLARLGHLLGRRLLAGRDDATVRAMLTDRGYVADPRASGAVALDDGARLASTAAADEVLTLDGARWSDAERARSAAWLDGAGRAAARSSLTQEWHLVQAYRAVGRPAPSDLGAVLDRWWQATGSHLTGPTTGDTLVETCSYVLLAGAGSPVGGALDLPGRRTALTRALTPAPEQAGDPQVGAMVATAWRELGNDPAGLAPLRDAVRSRMDDRGLARWRPVAPGDLVDTLAVEQVRALAGLPTADPPLARALRAVRADPTSADPDAAPLWAAALVAADPSADPRSVAAPGGDPPAAESVDVGTALARQLTVHARRLLGWPVPAVQVPALPGATPQQRFARNVVLLTLVETGQALPPAWRTDLATDAAEGLDLLRTGSLIQATAALRAAAALGWRPTGVDRRQARQALDRRAGCPGTPSLYPDVEGTGCSIQPTLAAWQLRVLLTVVPT
ncbi:MAG TPA: hypothetical protein VI248_23830 [Kineosporiaceae bacterium]